MSDPSSKPLIMNEEHYEALPPMMPPEATLSFTSSTESPSLFSSEATDYTEEGGEENLKSFEMLDDDRELMDEEGKEVEGACAQLSMAPVAEQLLSGQVRQEWDKLDSFTKEEAVEEGKEEVVDKDETAKDEKDEEDADLTKDKQTPNQQEGDVEEKTNEETDDGLKGKEVIVEDIKPEEVAKQEEEVDDNAQEDEEEEVESSGKKRLLMFVFVVSGALLGVLVAMCIPALLQATMKTNSLRIQRPVQSESPPVQPPAEEMIVQEVRAPMTEPVKDTVNERTDEPVVHTNDQPTSEPVTEPPVDQPVDEAAQEEPALDKLPEEREVDFSEMDPDKIAEEELDEISHDEDEGEKTEEADSTDKEEEEEDGGEDEEDQGSSWQGMAIGGAAGAVVMVMCTLRMRAQTGKRQRKPLVRNRSDMRKR